MKNTIITAVCSVGDQFPPQHALQGIVPDPSKEFKAYELYERWKRLCYKTKMGIGCEKCQFFKVIWK
jgi:hypothetical protein